MKMSTDRFSRVCLLVITFLLVLILLRPALTPSSSVHAAKSYRYELVKVYDDQTAGEARKALEKYTGDGWELVAAPFFSASQPGNWASGYLIFRK